MKSTLRFLHYGGTISSGHRKDGFAVGNPRLVNSAEMRRATREGVVIRHNRLTELDLTGTHGSTFVQRARSRLFIDRQKGCVNVRIFFRETGKAGAHQLMDEISSSCQ